MNMCRMNNTYMITDEYYEYHLLSTNITPANSINKLLYWTHS